jgi:hypothetical protein
MRYDKPKGGAGGIGLKVIGFDRRAAPELLTDARQ